METWAIVVAAGGGARFGGPKQFAPLGGSTVIDRAVATARESCDGVVVVLAAAAAWDPPAGVRTAIGGATRSASVRAGLVCVPETADVVVVHDAARPLASRRLFATVIDAVAGGADAAVPGLPVVDTLKRVDDHHVVETVSREGLVAVQTPQAFRAEALRAAHAGNGNDTDDAALVEAGGGKVVIVDGERRNLKLTGADDLELARTLLEGLQP
ncbi:MAG TPA: 2-C-methyl-D-erythritol 4-phosphate cytidylyltransferase [Acidimicrobiia bacterium]|nr:2-C-methyl-D-erythritol 4-phosphate cytidylyltransferase [Acidimicrobiia bacterium]